MSTPRHVRIDSPEFSTFPHWFGRAHLPLFGCLDLPRFTTATTGVIIVAPIGEEKLTTHRGLRYLAGRLASAGHAVLRFDFPGTGSSFSRSSNQDSWQLWVDSIGQAVAHVHSLGISSISIIDVRMSAFITETWLNSASEDELELISNVVHWAPPQTGKRWLRESQAKFVVAVGAMADDDSTFTALEFHVAREVADTIGSLSWKRLPLRPDISRTLALPSEDPDLRNMAPLRNMSKEIISVDESEFFFSPPTLIHHVPHRDIATLMVSLPAAQPGLSGGLSVDSPQVGELQLRVQFTAPNGEALEEIIELRTDQNLLAFTTRSREHASQAAVIFESTANEPAWGPTFLWVNYARRTAGGGLIFIRHDKDNYGESGVIVEGSIPILYSHQSRRDAIAVAQEVLQELPLAEGTPQEGTKPPLMLAGLCSGAWTSAETALEVDAHSVFLVNATQWSRKRRPVTKREARKHGLNPDTGGLMISSAEDSTKLNRLTLSLKSRVKSAIVALSPLVPLRLWEFCSQLGIGQSPGPLLRALKAQDISTSVMLSPIDNLHFRKHRGHDTLDSMASNAAKIKITNLDVPQGDHSLYRPDSRQQVTEQLDEFIDEFRTTFLSTHGDSPEGQIDG